MQLLTGFMNGGFSLRGCIKTKNYIKHAAFTPTVY